MSALRAPFPWFGGKSRVADVVWDRFGAVDNYVEPFAGSLAVLLGAPRIHRAETVNDLDGYICNFWRSVARDPDSVAHHADWPANENDLHARHARLVEMRPDFTRRLEGDPDFCDPKVAGWWVWGQCLWIGSGWCLGDGPWRSVEGMLVAGDQGQGVHRQLPHLGDQGRGLREWMRDLCVRLRRVRVCSGDWSRVLGPSVTTKLGTTAVFLDPPYSTDVRAPGLYAEDSGSVAADVARWAIEHGSDPAMRIALCGYVGEHDPPGWTSYRWSSSGAYAGKSTSGAAKRRHQETIWFSPHCITERQLSLFEAVV